MHLVPMKREYEQSIQTTPNTHDRQKRITIF